MGMNAHPAELLIGKLKALSPERLAEVEDFIDFLQARIRDSRSTEAAAAASEPAFRAVWDNDEDAVYDRL